MNKKVIVLASLLIATHQAAFAERRLFETNTSGFTTNTVGHAPIAVGTPSRFSTHSWYDPANIVTGYSSTGDRTETVFARSDWKFGWGNQPDGGSVGGFDSFITATVAEPSSETSKRDVDLLFQFFVVRSDDGRRIGVSDFKYHFAVTGEWSLSTLLSSDANFRFGVGNDASLNWVDYDFWTDETLPPLEMSAPNGYFVSSVPEPTSYAMLGLGLSLLGFAHRRRNTPSLARY